MKTEHTVKEMNFPQLSEQEEARLMGGAGVPPGRDTAILDEEVPL